MKKHALLIGMGLILSIVSHAQNTRFGFTAGIAVANLHAKSDDESDNGDSKLGLTLGVVVDVPLSENFSFQPALHLVQKGTKDEETFMNVTEKVSLTTNHIEIPFNFLYNVNGTSGTFFVGAGPSVAFAISGKSKYDDGTTTDEEDIEFGDSDDDDMKGLDIGANILAGYRFNNGLFIAVNFNKGLSNLVAGANPGDVKLTSSYFGIRLGFLLGADKKEK